jgi:hypothetical protein
MFKSRIISHRRRQQAVLVTVIGAAMSMILATNSCQALSGVSQSYHTADTNVTAGALVSTSADDKGGVELSTNANRSQIVGIVSDEPLVSLDTGSSNTVDVIVNGRTQVFVSDYNGAVKVGDKITTSSVAGIGAKATGSTTIVGTAQSDSGRGTVTKRTLTNTDGSQKTVNISLVDIQVAPATYAPPQKRSAVPAFSQDFANAIARRDVSPARVFIAMALTVLIFGSVIVVIYAAVKSSIISIGRNPLSAVSVQRSLLKICAIILVVIGLGTIVVYSVLTV